MATTQRTARDILRPSWERARSLPSGSASRMGRFGHLAIQSLRSADQDGPITSARLHAVDRTRATPITADQIAITCSREGKGLGGREFDSEVCAYMDRTVAEALYAQLGEALGK